VAALRLRLAEFEKDREELLRVRRQEAAARHKLKSLEWDHEVGAMVSWICQRRVLLPE
jgi:hypothetical protein